jgi:acetoin utilization protein AcuC
VFTISLHEASRWPFTGPARDRAGGAARNFPLPAGCNDSEFAAVMNQAVLPLIERLRPQAIMLQAGADALHEDPLAKLSLSNNSHRAVVQAVMALTPRLVVLGGGGYNPWTVGRCWALIWGTLTQQPIPDRLPPPAEAVLRGLHFDRAAGRNPPDHWFTTLLDAPRPGPVRDAIKHLIEETTLV